MTTETAQQIAMAIFQNENRAVCELSDCEICGYLVDRNLDETPENIAKIRGV